MKIITVTLNPCVDKTVKVSKLVLGGLNRLGPATLDASGKGINVSQIVAALGGDSVASGFLGTGSGEKINRMYRDLGLKMDFVSIDNPIRINLKVFCEDYGITEFNEPGTAVAGSAVEGLKKKLKGYASPGTVFVFSGSLPQGVRTDIYAELIKMVKEKGAAAFLDADGDAFRTAVEAGPDYIKPNKFELMQYFGKEGDITLLECADLCRLFINKGIKMAAVSMGAEGALFVTEAETLYAPGLRVNVLSTAAAGDSLVGAFLYAMGKGLPYRETVSLAVAASAGAVTTEGTKPPSRSMVYKLMEQVKLEEIGAKI